jgi:ubiquinone/menaquinone biosynthesis C-methylase UbiE
MAIPFTPAEIRRRYDDFADKYARMERWQEPLLGTTRLRRRLFSRARGDVLEVAAGTGLNFPHYDRDCRLTAVDMSPRMLELAGRRAARLGLDIDLRVMDAGALEFPDDSFDTVTSSLTLCTFPDPLLALREMARVCRPTGQILLLEHGRSDREWFGRFQDRRADRHAQQLGCYWNRRPLELVDQAGLTTVSSRGSLIEVFQTIEARP